MSPVQDLLTRLVAVPSVNPAHSLDADITGEARMADALTDPLEARGLRVRRLDLYGPGRPALIAESPPAPRRLMFGVHLDTVGVDHMTRPPFTPVIENGRLYGRGACDMKGATAALLTALTPDRVRALSERGVQLVFVATPNEECGTLGAARLVEGDFRADHAVILEPTRNRPVIAHKGAHWMEIDLKGRSGHGSQPENGVSANAALASLLPRLLALHRDLAARHPHPLLGLSTLNLGRIEGGTTFNIIADHTRVQLDRRVVPSEPPEAFHDGVRELLRGLVAAGEALDASFSLHTHTSAFATDPDSQLVRHLLGAIHRATGEDPEPEGTSWVSDAAPFSRVCDEILVFGPGDIAQAHTADEYIELASLDRGVRVFETFLDTYAP